MPNCCCYRRVLFALALFAFVADQGSKYGMFNWLYTNCNPVSAGPGHLVAEKDVIPGWFKFYANYETDGPACDCPLVKANGPVPPRAASASTSPICSRPVASSTA